MTTPIIKVLHQQVEIVASPDKTAPTSNHVPATAYRLRYSCAQIGKYKASTKRRITWHFGFTNLAESREGNCLEDCRGEEHEIELIWSLKSGKTRVFWNGFNISHYFRFERLFEEINFSWKARSGEVFQIAAHCKPLPDRPQYDLLIDGESFFALPRLSQLRAIRTDDVKSDISLSSVEEEGTEALTELTDDRASAEACRLRFTMDGGRLHLNDALEDELTSELLSNNVETLRNRLAVMVPDIEDNLSRAVIKAFTDDRGSTSSFSSCSFESHNPSPAHIELGVIAEALTWMNLNVDYAPRPDVEEQKRVFLQRQVDLIFMHVRSDNLNEDAAVRILCNLAALLGLELKIPQRKDTIIIHRVNKHVDEEDVICSLRTFGEIICVDVSKILKLGICRFRCETSASDLLAACENGSFKINGESPILSLLDHRSILKQPSPAERAQSDPNPTILKPCIERRKSHQRNIITIDTAISDTPFLTVDENSPFVSPTNTKIVLEQDLFSNLPSRSLSPSMFEAPAV